MATAKPLAASPPRARRKAKVPMIPPGCIQLPPIGGPPLLGTRKTHEGPRRHTFGAVMGLYVLDEIGLALDGVRRQVLAGATGSPSYALGRFAYTHAAPSLSPAAVTSRLVQERLAAWGQPRLAQFMGTVDDIAPAYSDRLARNLFDYLTLACFEEMRFCHSARWHNPGIAKSAHLSGYIRFDPRQALPVLAHAFRYGSWTGGYGDEKWALIAEAASLYAGALRATPLAFADHVVDITHHGGLAFNKGYLMDAPPAKAYLDALGVKRAGSILAYQPVPTPTLKCRRCGEPCGHTSPEQSRLPLANGAAGDATEGEAPAPAAGATPLTLLSEAKALNLIHTLGRFHPVEDPTVEPIQWGAEEFYLEITGAEKGKSPTPTLKETYVEPRLRGL